jgi:hypothetical protein
VFKISPTELLVTAGASDFHKIVEIIVQENFDAAKLINNVALLITSSPFPMDDLTIGTVCLSPPGYDHVGQKCSVPSWNANQSITLAGLTNIQCEKELRTSLLGKDFVLDESFLCVDRIKDTCRQNIGRPLVRLKVTKKCKIFFFNIYYPN